MDGIGEVLKSPCCVQIVEQRTGIKKEKMPNPMHENGSWVLLYRKMKKWEWYKDSYMVHIFIHLLISANWKDKMWQGTLIKRGQFITGRHVIAHETGISQQKIRTRLKKLKKSGEITIKSTNKYSIVTLCNYDKFQVDKKDINQQDNQQLTNKQPTDNQQITTTNEVNNLTNVMNVNESPPAPQGERPPKRKSKKKFTPPSIQDMQSYFEENGYTEKSALKAWEYYDAGDWHDAAGKPVISWKQKCRGVWFKPENKIGNENRNSGGREL